MSRDARTEELAANLSALDGRVAVAADQAGRDPRDVTVIVVTKYFGADDVRRLAALGVGDVGENRDQEARAKHEQCAGLPLRWHFVGQLQTNKAKSVVTYADLVHTVDRAGLVGALNVAAQRRGKIQDVLLQVNLDPVPDGHRGGVAPAGLEALLADALAAEALRVRGVMGVAPLGGDAGGAFATLAECLAVVRTAVPSAGIMSAGMSADLEVAVASGATHLRIGTAVLGSRQLSGTVSNEGGISHEGDAQ